MRYNPIRKKTAATSTFPTTPTSPISLPSRAVMTPIAAMVIKMPIANMDDKLKTRRRDGCSWLVMNPMSSGILARWQGLKRILKKPQVSDAPAASHRLSVKALLSDAVCVEKYLRRNQLNAVLLGD